MKKTLLFFTFLSNLTFAQNAELFNNNWYISQMVTNNQTTMTPAMQVSHGTSMFTNNGINNNFVSSYFNSAGSSIIFNTTTNSFIKQGTACTLGVYNGTNAAAVQAYDQQNCDFYLNPTSGTVFNYHILSNGTSKTLIITNSNTGNQVFYNNFFLSTKENSLKKTFRMYPNPVSDFLIIEDLEKDLKVKIYDFSGKQLYETISSGKILKVNLTHFPKAQYILSVEDFKSEFFIKK